MLGLAMTSAAGEQLPFLDWSHWFRSSGPPEEPPSWPVDVLWSLVVAARRVLASGSDFLQDAEKRGRSQRVSSLRSAPGNASIWTTQGPSRETLPAVTHGGQQEAEDEGEQSSQEEQQQKPVVQQEVEGDV